MLASPASFAAPRWLHTLLLVWVYLLVGAIGASAASSVIADFDGDSRPDRAELSRREPSTVRVWLSATRITSASRPSISTATGAPS
jgi:hypothetical protein